VIESPVNYRSPRLLVDFMNHLSLTEEPIEAGSGIVGFNPEWRWYEDEASLFDETENAVKGLIDAGYRPDKIAILSFQGLANSVFFGQNAPKGLNHIALKCQQGYHQSGQPKYSDGQLLVETLYRFKGQAADAVILTEIDFTELNPKNRRKLFVALTRARLHVVMITSQAAAAALTNAINANAAIE
jgi:superfamily I DNA/RNA helicase